MVLDLLMALPEELPLLDGDGLRQHMTEVGTQTPTFFLFPPVIRFMNLGYGFYLKRFKHYLKKSRPIKADPVQKRVS